MRNVFDTYNPEGEVNKNAHPAVVVYPWILQTASQARLTQPHERGTFFSYTGYAGPNTVPEILARS